MKHRKHVVHGTVVLSVLSGLVALYIQVDSHLMERKRLQAQMDYEAKVQVCETMGGHWYKGNCEVAP